MTKRDRYTYEIYKGNKKVYLGYPARRWKDQGEKKDFDTTRYDYAPTSRSTSLQREASRLATSRKGHLGKNSK